MQEDSATQVLDLWRKRALRSSRAHYATSQSFARLDIALTVGNVVSSIGVLVVGLVWPLLPSKGEESIMAWAHFALWLFSTAVVITAVCQYILNFSGRAARHSDAGARYAAIMRRMEQTLARGGVASELDDIRYDLDELGRWCPMIWHYHWHRQAKPADISEIEENFLPRIRTGP